MRGYGNVDRLVDQIRSKALHVYAESAPAPFVRGQDVRVPIKCRYIPSAANAVYAHEVADGRGSSFVQRDLQDGIGHHMLKWQVERAAVPGGETALLACESDATVDDCAAFEARRKASRNFDPW